MYVRVCMFVCTCVQICMYMVFVYVHSVRVYVYKHARVCLSSCLRANVCVYVCVYVDMCVCMYIHAYVRTYVRTYVCMVACSFVCWFACAPLSGPPKSASPPLGALSPVLCRSPLQPAPPPIAPPVGRNLPSPKSTRASVTLPLQCPRCSGDAPGEMLPRKVAFLAKISRRRDASEMLLGGFETAEMYLRCF